MILNGDNAHLLEELYQKFQDNDDILSSDWFHYFRNIETNQSNGQNGYHLRALPDQIISDNKEVGIQCLIESYRRFGNLSANLNPISKMDSSRDLLQPALYGLSEEDADTLFPTPLPGLKQAKLRDIITRLEKTYCSSIGIEYAYVRNTQERNWLEERMEAISNFETLPLKTRLRLYEKLFQAESFEKFLAQKYVAKKRFSIEGCETFIPLVDTAVEEASALGVKCIVMGMAHRGRLNVLVNVLQKPAGIIFAEFDENYNQKTIDYSDVKYHLGYSVDRPTLVGKQIHLSLAFNPSHLEAVSPVVLGSIRARQNKGNDHNRTQFMPVLIHGDAAFMGQGVVAESLNLYNLTGYRVGGTLHILINNQIGFTTLPPESRSTEYATDIAKGFQIPILHVNTDDPQAAYRAAKLALEYRQHFNKDVIIDLIGYRRLGHNETDEPAFTQPLMYNKIKSHPTTVNIHRKKLLNDPDIEEEDLKRIEENCRKNLRGSFEAAKAKNIHMKVDTMKGAWSDFSIGSLGTKPQTRLLAKQLKSTFQALTQLPTDFHIHPKLKRLLGNREKMYTDEIPIDWGFAEALAFGSLLENNYNIRLSGQDSKRGTFSHRHCVLVDSQDGSEYIPLNHISNQQGHFEVVNSPLSEFSVLGFEYGYSLADPKTLVLWEAQFGDFANGAQIIFDQFISSSEVKWHRMSGLVILLPHGYEGQGPEHSSARIERYLQLCANDNMQVCNCSTPAQYFHLLRRQILRKFRKPLIIMTPKSLLRLNDAGSSMADISKGLFHEVIYDRNNPQWMQAKRILLCSGKIFYALEEHQKKKKRNDVSIIRIEQLYPLPAEGLKEIWEKCNSVKDIYWVQEEPLNQGAWNFLQGYLRQLLKRGQILKCIARQESASPAAGLQKVHIQEQKSLVEQAFS